MSLAGPPYMRPMYMRLVIGWNVMQHIDAYAFCLQREMNNQSLEKVAIIQKSPYYTSAISSLIGGKLQN